MEDEDTPLEWAQNALNSAKCREPEDANYFIKKAKNALYDLKDMAEIAALDAVDLDYSEQLAPDDFREYLEYPDDYARAEELIDEAQKLLARL